MTFAVNYERMSDDVDMHGCPHQQQCPSNIVERYKLNDSFDNVECCFDIVAVFGNNVAGFGNNVERNYDKVETNLIRSIRFDFVERTKFYNRIVRRCAVYGNESNAASTVLLLV